MGITEIETIKSKYDVLKPELNERGRRIWAATEANSLGHGGVAIVVQATGLSDSTIKAGRRELKHPTGGQKKPNNRVRKKGGGRKRLQDQDIELLELLDGLVDPTSRGDPLSPLRWTCKSTRRLSRELSTRGHVISHAKVGELLNELGYSLQSNRKRMEGKAHPDRNAQFEFINSRVMHFQNQTQPVISVDAKKKELIGRFANAGREYQPKGKPEETETYDFPSLADGKGIPYGIYDMNNNKGWVSVGTDHDTAQFAVQAIRQWWNQMGRASYPAAKELLITADGGGSNGSRNRLWKHELQGFADESELIVSAIFHPVPASGIRLNIECFLTLPKTGVDDP